MTDESFSVIVPVYAGVGTLTELVRRVDDVFASEPRLRCLILVDDASPDDSWATIVTLSERHERVCGVRLADNVGQLVAMAVGSREAMTAGSEIALSLDCDLENRPEDLPRMLDEVDRGHDLVSAVRVNRDDRPPVRRAISAIGRRLAAGAWDFTPRDLGCGMKAWRTETAEHANRRLSPGGGMGWVMDLFDACERYGEVEVRYERRTGNSAYSLGGLARLGLTFLRLRFFPGLRRRSEGAAYAVAERCGGTDAVPE